MQLSTIVVLFFLVATIDCFTPNPNFLFHVGSFKHNETGDGHFTVKNYYVSQRIIYNWIDSYFYCKSVGLRIANIQSPQEMKNLAIIANKEPDLFKEAVYIDGKKMNSTETSNKCLSVLKRTRGRFEIKRVECHGKRQKFLCEDVEISDSFTEEKALEPAQNLRTEYELSDGHVDVRGTFFRRIGDYANTKFYYISDFERMAYDALKICQSFNMILASPKSQDEFRNLQNKIYYFSGSWQNGLIAAYRSEEDHDSWVDYSDKLNYELDWASGEPNDSEGKENCVAFKKGGSTVNDVDCYMNKEFICEYDSENVKSVEVDESELSRFFNRVGGYDASSSEMKTLYSSKFEMDWVNAKLLCQTYGMELLTPSSSEDNTNLLEFLNSLPNLPVNIFVGFTKKGNRNQWYSVNTGDVLSFKIPFNFETPIELGSDDQCLVLHQVNGKWLYQETKCFKSESNFFCQKSEPINIVLEYKEDEVVEETVSYDETTQEPEEETTNDTVDESTSDPENVVDI